MTGAAINELQEGYEPKITGERALWITVLQQTITDLCQRWQWIDPDRPEKGRQMRQVSRDVVFYIGARPSRDFRELCYMAGVDPHATHSRLLAMTTWPEAKLLAHNRSMRPMAKARAGGAA